MRLPATILLFACTLLAACATTTREGRTQFVANPLLGSVYSDVGLRVKLATTTDLDTRGYHRELCPLTGCDTREDFERKVQTIGERLAQLAYSRYPDLVERVPKFHFSVVMKADVGTLSNGDGEVVVLGGLRRKGLDDNTLALLLAREMGHVISRHHDEDSATSILFSIATGLLFPVSNLLRGVAAVAQSGIASSVLSSAASYAGSSMVRASYRSDQVREADAVAAQLLIDAGLDIFDVADTLNASTSSFGGDDDWSKEWRVSGRWFAQVASGPRQDHSRDAQAASLADNRAVSLPALY